MGWHAEISAEFLIRPVPVEQFIGLGVQGVFRDEGTLTTQLAVEVKGVVEPSADPQPVVTGVVAGAVSTVRVQQLGEAGDFSFPSVERRTECGVDEVAGDQCEVVEDPGVRRISEDPGVVERDPPLRKSRIDLGQ